MAEKVAELIIGIGADLSDFDRKVAELDKKFAPVQKRLSKIGKGLTVGVTLPLTALAAASTKAAVNFESAFAGVQKTVNATESEFATLRKGILDMSKELPSSANEIASVTEAAGQLGIQNSALLSFTRTMVDLGETTNLSSQQAATSLARFANITQSSQDKFSNLGSAIVELGNNLATTEREIVEMSLRLAGSGKQIGLAESQILGFAAALSSVGVEAEAGGTAFSKLFAELAGAVSRGGSELDAFAKVAGKTSQDFAKQFRDDAAGAVQAFVTGLGDISRSGGDTFAVLEQLGITEIRMRDALLRTAGASNVLGDALDISAKGWRENVALTEEAQKRYDTTAARLQKLRNRFVALAIDLGDKLIPVLDAIAGALEVSLKFIENMPTPVKGLAIAFGVLAAALGPTVFAFSQVIRLAPAVALALNSMGAAAVTAATVTKAALISTGIGAAVVALGTLAALVAGNWDKITAATKEFAAGQKSATNVATAGILNVADAWDKAGRAAERAGRKVPGIAIPTSGPRVDSIISPMAISRAASGLDLIRPAANKVTAAVTEIGEAAERAADKLAEMMKRARPQSLGARGLVAAPEQTLTGLLLPTDIPTPDNIRGLTEASQELQDSLAIGFERLTEGASNAKVALASLGLAFRESLGDAAAQITGQLVEGILTMQEGFRTLGDVVKSFGQIAQSVLSRLVADLAAAAAKAAVLSVLFPGAGSFGGIFSSILGFGGGRASGGPVSSGTSYVVGEKGPELFVPRQSGTIIPNVATRSTVRHVVQMELHGNTVRGVLEINDDRNLRGGHG